MTREDQKETVRNVAVFNLKDIGNKIPSHGIWLMSLQTAGYSYGASVLLLDRLNVEELTDTDKIYERGRFVKEVVAKKPGLVIFTGPFSSTAAAWKYFFDNGNQANLHVANLKKSQSAKMSGLGENASVQQDIEAGTYIPKYPDAPIQDMEKWKQTTDSPMYTAWKIASAISCAAGAYHGYKRNESVGWALCWGFLGGLFPVITPAIAVAQGFGEKRKDLK